MKKLIALSLAVLALNLSATAQVFNHLALGLGAGTDGLSVELASPLGSHVDVRAGYGTALGLVGYTVKGISIPEHPGNALGASASVPLKIKLGMSDARLLFNIYPGSGGFHFTVGAYAGAARFVRGMLIDMPNDYNTVGLDVDGYLVKATANVLPVSLLAPGLGKGTFGVKPYIGIGFGRAVQEDKRVTFTFDLGAQYQGTPGVWAIGEGITGRQQPVQITEKQLKEIGDIVNDYGKYLAFWPTLNFHLYVRLF